MTGLRSLWPVAMLVATGCSLAGPPVAPGPVAVPSIEVEGAVVEAESPVLYLTPPEGEMRVDALLASPVLRDPDFLAELDHWIDYWQSGASTWFPEFLSRMGGFEQTVDSALAARGLPESLRYLPLIESGYNPGARSHASAVGMWQFMAGTAREFGMEVGPFVDERRNPYKSTESAVGFLEELNDRFGSWFVALAAYNGGPNRAQRILREQAPLEQPSDSLFWALRAHWPRETRDFVPKLVAAALVAQRPAHYGYEPHTPDPPFAFDEVEVPDATTFDVLAQAAGVDEAEIHRLNPELFRGFTPPQRAVPLRVPLGRAAIFRENYARIPANERMTVVEHFVANGETLSHIARRYGISIVDLQAANPDIRPRYLRIGARLTVPIMLGRS